MADPNDLFFDENSELNITHRNLPHWKQGGKLYFITWRQADSLPQEQLQELRMERAAWLNRHGKKTVQDLPAPFRNEYPRIFHHRVQTWLDAGYGSCVLLRAEAREIMISAFHHFKGQRYRLGSFVVAGNHVHVLVAPGPGVDVSSVLHAWKSFTSNAINKAIGRIGPLWMDESYDRLVRDPGHLERIETYMDGHIQQGAYVERIDLMGTMGEVHPLAGSR
ncbi:MAG TPA: transposase [Flavobacteriales bacterium]